MGPPGASGEIPGKLLFNECKFFKIPPDKVFLRSLALYFVGKNFAKGGKNLARPAEEKGGGTGLGGCSRKALSSLEERSNFILHNMLETLNMRYQIYPA